jgi:ATP-dependent Clp protease adaptor protein ClpS
VADTLERTSDKTDEETNLVELTAPDHPWITLVWNDPVNLMQYVTYVFTSYFGFSAGKAKRLMMQVHTEGKAVVASGPREEMERHVAAMHGYGLWATLQKESE